MFDAIAAAVVASLMSPVVVLWLQHRYVWRPQRRLEMKHAVFKDAVRALSLWSRDAMDPGLQADKPSHGGSQRLTELTPETGELLERSKHMVRAFFSSEAYSDYEDTLRSHIAMDNVPNEDFEEKATKAIVAMARELGIGS